MAEPAFYSQVTELADVRSAPGAIDKAMTILAKLIDDKNPARLADLSRSTGIPKATAHRILGVLCEHRMVARHGQHYFPGERLFEVTRWAGGKYLDFLRQESTPHLAELHQRTGFTAGIGILTGETVQYANRVYSHQAMRTPSFLSGQAPAQSTAIGRILLAGAQQRHEFGWTTELSELHRRGVAHNRGSYVVGLTCVAVPLDICDSAQAALVLSGPTDHVNVPAATAILRRSAYAMSRPSQLGVAAGNPRRVS